MNCESNENYSNVPEDSSPANLYKFKSNIRHRCDNTGTAYLRTRKTQNHHPTTDHTAPALQYILTQPTTPLHTTPQTIRFWPHLADTRASHQREIWVSP